LKRIIWAVDFFTFDKRLGCDPDTCARLDGSLRLLIVDNLLSSEALDSSFSLLKRAIAGPKILSGKALAPVPWSEDFICRRFQTQAAIGLVNVGENGSLRQILSESPLYRNMTCCDEGMALFRGTVDEIKRAGVQLILFLPPMTQYELEEIRQNGLWPRFQQFKRDLTLLAPYWDFTGYNELARTDTMFLDVVHMKPEAGMTILRMLLHLPDSQCRDTGIVRDSGLWVDTHDIDQVLTLQDDRERAANVEPNKYARLVARALGQGHGDLASAIK